MGTATVKLIFNAKKITKEEVEEVVKQYTKDFTIHSINDEYQTAFAVVDVPEEIVSKLNNNKSLRHLDLMTSNGICFGKNNNCASGT